MPDLIGILESAPSEFTRNNVLIALGEKLKDPRAVPTLAAHMSDPNRYARYDSLAGLKNITHEEACTSGKDWSGKYTASPENQRKGWSNFRMAGDFMF